MSVTATDGVTTCRVVAMGAYADLMIVGGDGRALAGWAADRLNELEARWSRFLPDSELNVLHARAGAGPAAASPDLTDAVGRALSLWYVSDGLFDPTVRGALEAIGYDRTFRDIAPEGPDLLALPPPAPGCARIRVDRENGSITLPDGIALDLGGLGKGLAADIVASGLVERGATGACVGLGGDVRVAGSPIEGEAWRIRVEDPFDESRTLCTRALRDEAIVTSTTRFRHWTRGARKLHHIIDPATGAPAARGVTAVIAQSDEAWWAEGVAKAAVVAGVEPGLALLERLGVAALVVDTSGGHHSTRAWDAP
jgi:thiamine biosynthesis lipoprotein